MKIANNIIKDHLKNVYFLCGGAYGGKTTMAKLIEEKHGFFAQPPRQYSDWMQAELREEAQFTIADLMNIPSNKKVIVDGCIPVDILKEISDYDHVFLLFSPDEMKRAHYFDRADKDEIYQFILSFPDGNELLGNVIEALNIDNEAERQRFVNSGFAYKERTNSDTIEETLELIEKHFGLI